MENANKTSLALRAGSLVVLAVSSARVEPNSRTAATKASKTEKKSQTADLQGRRGGGKH